MSTSFFVARPRSSKSLEWWLLNWTMRFLKHQQLAVTAIVLIDLNPQQHESLADLYTIPAVAPTSRYSPCSRRFAGPGTLPLGAGINKTFSERPADFSIYHHCYFHHHGPPQYPPILNFIAIYIVSAYCHTLDGKPAPSNLMSCDCLLHLPFFSAHKLIYRTMLGRLPTLF